MRDTILASWRRSREWHVAADRIDLSYVRDPDLDTPLTRTALPVLQNLRDNLEGEPISVILTDAHGVALSRLTADRDLERYLDSVQLAPGFSYAEEFVCTNAVAAAARACPDPATGSSSICSPATSMRAGGPAAELDAWRQRAPPLAAARPWLLAFCARPARLTTFAARCCAPPPDRYSTSR